MKILTNPIFGVREFILVLQKMFYPMKQWNIFTERILLIYPHNNIIWQNSKLNQLVG